MSIKVVFEGKDGKTYPLDGLFFFDPATGSLATIDASEVEVHHGDAFTTSFVDTTLANTDTVILAFKTPRPPEILHLYISFSTLVGGYVTLWEAPTWDTNSGTPTAIVNRRRTITPTKSHMEEDKTYTPEFETTQNVLANVTNLAGGTPLRVRNAWGERGKVGAGESRAQEEFLLMPATQYAVVFTARGSSNMAELVLNWVEH